MRDPTDPQPQRRPSLQRLLEQRWLHFLLLACVMTFSARFLVASHWRWADFFDNLILDESFRLRGSTDAATVAGDLPNTKAIKIIELRHSIPRPILAKLLAKFSQAKVVALDMMLVDNAAELTPTEKSWYGSELNSWQQDDKILSQQLPKNSHCVGPLAGVGTHR